MSQTILMMMTTTMMMTMTDDGNEDDDRHYLKRIYMLTMVAYLSHGRHKSVAVNCTAL